MEPMVPAHEDTSEVRAFIAACRRQEAALVLELRVGTGDRAHDAHVIGLMLEGADLPVEDVRPRLTPPRRGTLGGLGGGRRRTRG